MTESNIARELREQREAAERHQAELEKNPQQAAMTKATELTETETEQLRLAEERLREAEAGLASAVNALSRARRGMAPIRTPDQSKPFNFFLKRPDTYKAAAAALPDLTSDVEEARAGVTSAIKRRNALIQAISRARNERRRQAKVKHSPPPPPVKSRGDWWSSMERLGRKDAA